MTAEHRPPIDLGSDLAHPGVGLVVLLVIQVLNVYKPQGMTGLGAGGSTSRHFVWRDVVRSV